MSRAFDDQVNMRIDYPCYPQLISMINQFLEPLSEIIESLDYRATTDKFYLFDEFEVPKENVALEYGKFMVDFLNERPYLKELIKGTKACLTGPFTLASELYLSDTLSKGVTPLVFKEPKGIRLEWVVEKIAEIMKNIGKAYSNMGIDIISMDEPILSLIVGRRMAFHNEEFLIEMINKAISGIDKMPSVHVCGRISPKLRDILLQTNVKIMDHEFRTNESNFKIFERTHLESNDKLLGLGTIKSNFAPQKDAEINDYVEDIKFLQDYIKKGVDTFGKDNLVIKPDCGFGALKSVFGDDAYEIVLRKLNNMVLAVQEFK